MGQIPSEIRSIYQVPLTNGDIPRDYMAIFDNNGKGWAYYSSSEEGVCNICNIKTNMWFVTIRDRGKHLCNECKNKKSLEEEVTLM